jgi:hypothetical protein
MLEQSRLEELDLDAKEATETNSDSHSDNFYTKSNHIVIFFTLLTSHTTVQSTATSEIELRGDITVFAFFGYFVANDLNFRSGCTFIWRFRVLDYSL